MRSMPRLREPKAIKVAAELFTMSVRWKYIKQTQTGGYLFKPNNEANRLIYVSIYRGLAPERAASIKRMLEQHAIYASTQIEGKRYKETYRAPELLLGCMDLGTRTDKGYFFVIKDVGNVPTLLPSEEEKRMKDVTDSVGSWE